MIWKSLLFVLGCLVIYEHTMLVHGDVMNDEHYENYEHYNVPKNEKYPKQKLRQHVDYEFPIGNKEVVVVRIKKEAYIKYGKFIQCHKNEPDSNCFRAIDCHKKYPKSTMTKYSILPIPIKKVTEYHSCKLVYELIHASYLQSYQLENEKKKSGNKYVKPTPIIDCTSSSSSSSSDISSSSSDSLSSSPSSDCVKKPKSKSYYHGDNTPQPNYPVEYMNHPEVNEIDLKRCTVSYLWVDIKLFQKGKIKKCPRSPKNKVNIYSQCQIVALVYDCPTTKHKVHGTKY